MEFIVGAKYILKFFYTGRAWFMPNSYTKETKYPVTEIESTLKGFDEGFVIIKQKR